MGLKVLFIFLLLISPCYAAITIGTDCHTGNEDSDTLTLSCEIAACDNAIMIVSITREESGDDEPDALTWNGTSLLANKIVSDGLATGNGEIFQYYLLNPAVGNYDLVVTWAGSASVYTVMGLVILCGVEQQAPEANCASGDDVNNCLITTVSAGAALISTGGSTTNQSWAVTGTDLDTEIYEQASPPAFGTDGCMGHGDTAAAGEYNCAWTNSGSSDNASVICSAWEAAAAGTSSTRRIFVTD